MTYFNPAVPQPMRELLTTDGPLVTALRAAFPNALAVYAFGSQMQGQAGPDSDLDMAVLVAGYADPLQLWRMSGELADLAGCSVDLLDLRAVSTVMQSQVLQTGERLWGKPLEAGLFECYIMREKCGSMNGVRVFWKISPGLGGCMAEQNQFVGIL